jgi:hypothetical protein
MFNQLMVRLFGGASMALLLLAGLFTSARALGDPPEGHWTCIVLYNCNPSSCPKKPPCGNNQCESTPTFGCGCYCAPYTMGQQECGCTTAIP